MNDLELLAELWANVKQARQKFTIIKQQWYTWNYWAKKQSWYGSWMQEHHLGYSQIIACYPYKLDMRYDREDGWRYYQAWRGGQQANKDLSRAFHRQLEICELKTDTNGKRAYSRLQIAEALDSNEIAVGRLVSQQPWFTPRRKTR